jgi:hypothetical protein
MRTTLWDNHWSEDERQVITREAAATCAGIARISASAGKLLLLISAATGTWALRISAATGTWALRISAATGTWALRISAATGTWPPGTSATAFLPDSFTLLTVRLLARGVEPYREIFLVGFFRRIDRLRSVFR